jgi:hypothetical protein
MHVRVKLHCACACVRVCVRVCVCGDRGASIDLGSRNMCGWIMAASPLWAAVTTLNPPLEIYIALHQCNITDCFSSLNVGTARMRTLPGWLSTPPLLIDALAIWNRIGSCRVVATGAPGIQRGHDSAAGGGG